MWMKEVNGVCARVLLFITFMCYVNCIWQQNTSCCCHLLLIGCTHPCVFVCVHASQCVWCRLCRWEIHLSIPVSYTHLDVYKRQPLNRSSPKTIGREYSTNQVCMQKIIWFCLNLRLLSFAIENTLVKT